MYLHTRRFQVYRVCIYVNPAIKRAASLVDRGAVEVRARHTRERVALLLRAPAHSHRGRHGHDVTLPCTAPPDTMPQDTPEGVSPDQKPYYRHGDTAGETLHY